MRWGVPLAGTRARVADAPGAWLLSVLVVALATVLAVVVPAGVAVTADDAVRAAVRVAGDGADTVVTAPFAEDVVDPGRRPTSTAADTVALAEDLPGSLAPDLAAVLAPPVAVVETRAVVLSLPTATAVQLGPTSLRFDWVHRADGAAVTWTAGSAPAAATGGEVQAGVSGAVAAALGVAPGDRLTGAAATGVGVDVLVTGVFAVADEADPAWTGVPDLLAPSTRGAGADRRTTVAVLVSDASVPDARLAAEATRTITLAARPEAFTAAGAEAVAEAVAALRASPVTLRISPLPTVDSRLGAVLLSAADQLAAARAQAAVLVTAGVLATGLVLLLGAAVLVDRRRTVLAAIRARGGSLPGLGVSLLAESAVLTAVGVGVGLGVGLLLAPGYVSGSLPGDAVVAGVVPTALAGLLALPVLGVRAADRATGGDWVPLDRRARLRAARDRSVRRWTADGALVLLAVGAVVALAARGLDGPLVVAAPALAVLAGAVLVARVQPAVSAGLLRWALRARGAVPLLAAAGVRSRAVLGPVALTAITALATLSLALGATTTAGQVEASWTAVGADATVTVDPLPADLPTGGDLAVPARVTDGVQLSTPSGGDRTRVVVVDPTAYARLVEATPLPDVDGLDDLGYDGDRVRALVTPDVVGSVGSLLLDGVQVPIAVVGTLPAGPTTVLLAASAVPADLAVPDTLWLTGPGAAAAAASVPGGDVEMRSSRLAVVQDAPLTRGLVGLVGGTAVLLGVLAVLAVVLAGSAGVRRRRSTSGVLRTLGLGERQARAVALLELLPGVLSTVLPGIAIGALVAALVAGPLGLAQLTGQDTDPGLVVPWSVLGLVVPPVVAVVVLVVGEARARRRVPLAQVLREG
ncbi:putative ABC transport system permease protein [Klenkia soli]|uniref:Putative ABC transport system permease protein n=1 Tax=Klenkia soli TaxID=1052260 RepID=A0A1H0RPS2_9ACTN|nr:FtsX-like permease family protein [Klenkia soli]SDP31473.1 putative ABC transport system permease protein [Klenkia soli]